MNSTESIETSSGGYYTKRDTYETNKIHISTTRHQYITMETQWFTGERHTKQRCVSRHPNKRVTIYIIFADGIVGEYKDELKNPNTTK